MECRICMLAGGNRYVPVKANCENDAVARALAQRMLEIRAEMAEIWEDGRLVAEVSIFSTDEVSTVGKAWL